MKRKNIAVCVTGFNLENESRIVNGIYEQCRKLNINLLIFATMIKKPEFNSEITLPESVILGETEIFSLINYDTTDGIIILGESIIDESVLVSVQEKARAYGIPVVNVNDPSHTLDKNILLSDKIAMEFIVRHLVEDHGFRKINFIGGFPGNLQTEERLAAYKKILSENNIPVEENRIYYGEFWKKAYECTEEIINSGELPEAIVCASDTMAVFCMDCLKNHGYKIPEDIVVTGFDGISDCEAYSPTLTTARHAFQESGETAVQVLADIWEGKQTEDTICVDSVLFRQQSCGCVKIKADSQTDYYSEKYGILNSFKEFNAHIIVLNTIFANSSTSAELYAEAKRGAEFFGLKNLYICVRPDSESEVNGFDEIQTKYRGISEKMLSMYDLSGNIVPGTEFLSSGYIPQSFSDGEESVCYAFSPVYFKERFIGYMAYEPSGIKGYRGDLFATWVITIANNAGSFYIKNELEAAARELENLYIRDPLTGLYNRRGMEKLKHSLIEQAKASDVWVTVVCADIDNLKPINDIYGHEAGDNAILQTASAIEASMPEGSVCTRTGGDEFCIILSHNNESDIGEYLSHIDEVLNKYNESSGLPYKVGCSCGYYSVHSGNVTSIDSMIKLADENMYDVKKRKKTQR